MLSHSQQHPSSLRVLPSGCKANREFQEDHHPLEGVQNSGPCYHLKQISTTIALVSTLYLFGFVFGHHLNASSDVQHVDLEYHFPMLQVFWQFIFSELFI